MYDIVILCQEMTPKRATYYYLVHVSKCGNGCFVASGPVTLILYQLKQQAKVQ